MDYHPLLRRKLFELKKLALVSGEEIIFDPTADGRGLIAANKSRGYVGILCVSDRVGATAKIHSYHVNIGKWLWAESEGFSRDQMVDDPVLKSEIFKKTPFLELLEKLLK